MGDVKGLSGRIFVTGGAGFLGRAIIRRAQREKWPCEFTVYSRDEEKQFNLQNKYGSMITCYLGDVRDYQAMVSLMAQHDVVIHAAAVKFVPEAERNVWETIKVNIDGSRNIARAAAWCGVPKVLAISTDKACQPSSLYGVTKLAMERLLAECNRWREPTIYSTVRYGNVVGSTGSIIPVFRNQLRQTRRVKVTDDRMTRFWLSVDEAIDIILIALDEMVKHPGVVVVPRCGAMKVIDLAHLIAGKAPIDITGIRPGEKIHEALIHHQESVRVEHLGDYFLVHPQSSGPVQGKVEPWTYTSQSPAEWIDTQKMAAMIKDAEDV